MENKDSFQNLADTTEELINHTKDILARTGDILSQNEKSYNNVSDALEKQIQLENNRANERKRIINQYLEANKLYDDKDYKKAAEAYRSSIEPQIAAEQREWGTLFFEGDGVLQSYIEAAYWWNLAVQNGDSYAPAFLASLFLEGLGVEVNYKIALDLLEMGVERDDTQSKRALGIILLDGMYKGTKITEKDLKRGFELLSEAAEEYDIEAKGIVGHLYLTGECDGYHIVDKDFSKGLKMLTEAAEKGNAQSQYFLAVSYYDENNNNLEYSKARYWAEKAAENGEQRANDLLVKIEDKEKSQEKND